MAEASTRVLVVDDDRDLLDVLQHILASDGYDVVAVASAPAALDECEKQMPSLIITDLMMPRMDGEAFLAELRRRWPAKSRPPVVLLSASARRNEVRKRMAVAGSLGKPFELAAIREMVARFTETSDDGPGERATLH